MEDGFAEYRALIQALDEVALERPMTAWELTFLNSLLARMEDEETHFHLTARQREVLDRMQRHHLPGRKRARIW